MKKNDNPANTETAKFVIGREDFAKISVVQGIELSKPMKDRAIAADRAGMSDEQRREAIIRAHRKV